MSKSKPTFDYRAARDRVYGLIRNRSGRVVGYREPATTIAERALLLALIEFAPNMEPSKAALCRMLPADARRVKRLIASCQEKGLLEVHYRTGGRSRYVLLDLPFDPPDPLPMDPPKQTSKAVRDHFQRDLEQENALYAAGVIMTELKKEWVAVDQFTDTEPEPDLAG